MKNLKGRFSLCVLTVVCLALLVQGSLPASQKVKVLLPPADIQLTKIETYGCVCEDSLNLVNALVITEGIEVSLYNAGPGTTDVRVEVTFYDYKTCNLRTIIPHKTILTVKPNTGRAVFIKGPFLIRKSAKIKAYAYPIPETLANGNQVDQYPKNNRKEIGECHNPIL